MEVTRREKERINLEKSEEKAKMQGGGGRRNEAPNVLRLNSGKPVLGASAIDVQSAAVSRSVSPHEDDPLAGLRLTVCCVL